MRARALVGGLAITAVTVAGTVGLPLLPAAAVSTDSITVGADVVHLGAKVPVKVTGLYNASSCRMSVMGPARGKVVSVPVRNYEAKTRVQVPSGPSGLYSVKVSCGKDGTATSKPFRAVAAGNPTKASCEATESGFSMNPSKSSASFGVVLANRSPDLTAVNVDLALTWRDSAGNVVKTTSLDGDDIRPANSVYVATDGISAPNAASVSIAVLCETGESSELTPITGTGGSRRDSDDELITFGQFANSSGKTISEYSSVVILLRDASGAIVGGDSDSLDAFVLPGGVGTWTSYSGYYFPGTAPSVHAMLFPEERS